MAAIVCKATKKMWCERAGEAAELYEERVYPDDVVPDVGGPYRVRARLCSLGVKCNLLGYNCCWAGTNPGYDPFESKRA